MYGFFTLNGYTAYMRKQCIAQQQSDERIRRFIEDAPAAIAMFDRDMRYLAASRRWFTDYGLQGQLVIGRSHYEVFPDISDEWKAIHQRALAGEVMRATEDRFQRANGSVQWLRWEVRPWRQQDGAVGGVIMFTEDISDLKTVESELQRRIQEHTQAEAALRKSEAQYRTIVETAQEGIWIFDGNFHTTYANQRMAEMLQYPSEEICGRSVFDFIFPNDHDEMQAHIHQRMLGEKEVYEFCFRRQDGTELWVLISGSPLFDEQGEFSGTFAMITDVTDRHFAEQYQREFARRTIEAATDGKLILSTREEVMLLAGPALACWDISQVEDLTRIRHAVAEIARTIGMEEERIHDYLICISEAATNAFKHAGQGQCSLHRFADALCVVIADNGSGILPINLPEVALKPGYTTGGSLGMGYKAMISIADKVFLATGPDGTVVAIQMALKTPAEPMLVLPNISALW